MILGVTDCIPRQTDNLTMLTDRRGCRVDTNSHGYTTVKKCPRAAMLCRLHSWTSGSRLLGTRRALPGRILRRTEFARRTALEKDEMEVCDPSSNIDDQGEVLESGDDSVINPWEACSSFGQESTNQGTESRQNWGALRYLKEIFTVEKVPMAPWGMDTILTVLILWIIGFWIAAYSLVPRVLSFLKGMFLSGSLAYSGEAALRHLLLDVSQIIWIYVLLNRSLKKHRPRLKEFFKVSWRSATSWSTIFLGFCTFPAVDWLHRTMVAMMVQKGIHGVSVVSGTKMFEGDGLFIKFVWFFVLGVVAPIWEEIMFRGFLLPSLARIFSPVMGIFLTSFLFSLVHFTKEGFLPLMILGAIFGMSYCVTRNLFPAIMLHGLWNMYLLAQVMTQ